MDFVSRHPLEAAMSARSMGQGANWLSVPRQPAIWSVLAHKDREEGIADTLRSIDGLSVRFCGPYEWLVVASAHDRARIGVLLGNIAGASVAEQGDGQTVLTLSGPDIRAVLTKCTAVDLHPSAFAVGKAANALVCNVSCNLARLAPNTYELIVMRSFSTFVFEEICLMGREFTLSAKFAD